MKTGINYRKWRTFGALAILAGAVAISHQNCGPAMQSAGSDLDDSSYVDTIDDVSATTGLAFSAKSVEVHSLTDQVSLDGVCSEEQEGAIFGWQVVSQTKAGALSLQSAPSEGSASCSQGKFKVELMPAQSLLQCGESYTVVARLGNGQPGEVVVTRRCPAEVAAKASPAVHELLQVAEPSSCVFERSESVSTGCSVVCYSASGVVEKEQEVDAKSCSL